MCRYQIHEILMAFIPVQNIKVIFKRKNNNNNNKKPQFILEIHKKYLDLVNRSPETTDPLLRLFQKLEKVGISILIHEQLKGSGGTYMWSAEWHPRTCARAECGNANLSFSFTCWKQKKSQKSKWEAMFGNLFGRTDYLCS